MPPKRPVTSQHYHKSGTKTLKHESLENISDPKYSTCPKRPPRLRPLVDMAVLSSGSSVPQHPRCCTLMLHPHAGLKAARCGPGRGGSRCCFFFFFFLLLTSLPLTEPVRASSAAACSSSRFFSVSLFGVIFSSTVRSGL